MAMERGSGNQQIKEMIKNADNSGLEEALKRARELVDKAAFNEAIRTIEDLEREVADMHIASRFSRTHGVDRTGGGFPEAGGGVLSQAEQKRQSILISLRRLKNEIATSVTALESIVLDIEATRTEG